MSERRGAVYVDASALVKLVIQEPESDALRALLASAGRLVASRVAVVEVLRAVRRHTERDAAAQAAVVLEGLLLIESDREIADAAASLQPASLRSLDAIHLASAIALGDELDALVTYDARLADAAGESGVTVIAPA